MRMKSDEMNDYIDWVEAFKDSMLHEVEPVSLVDYNVSAVLDYAREMGLPQEAIEKEFQPWILEGYKRAHERAIQRFKTAEEGSSLHDMKSAFDDILGSGLRIGMRKEEIERRYRFEGLTDQDIWNEESKL